MGPPGYGVKHLRKDFQNNVGKNLLAAGAGSVIPDGRISNRKGGIGNPPPTVGAPELYPNGTKAKAGHRVENHCYLAASGNLDPATL